MAINEYVTWECNAKSFQVVLQVSLLSFLVRNSYPDRILAEFNSTNRKSEFRYDLIDLAIDPTKLFGKMFKNVSQKFIPRPFVFRCMRAGNLYVCKILVCKNTIKIVTLFQIQSRSLIFLSHSKLELSQIPTFSHFVQNLVYFSESQIFRNLQKLCRNFAKLHLQRNLYNLQYFWRHSKTQALLAASFALARMIWNWFRLSFAVDVDSSVKYKT